MKISAVADTDDANDNTDGRDLLSNLLTLYYTSYIFDDKCSSATHLHRKIFRANG